MRTYTVTMGVELTMEAESLEEAIELAESYCEAVAPNLEVIDAGPLEENSRQEIDGQLSLTEDTF